MSARDEAKARVRAKVNAARSLPARDEIANLLHATYTHAEAEQLLAEFLAEEKTTAPVATAVTPACPCTTPNEHTPEYQCVCREDPTSGPAHEGHTKWCPAGKPTPERITEIRQGIGDELTRDELTWLSGAAARNELHITGARGGHWPMRDLPGAVLLLSQYLAATVAVIERSLPRPEDKASATPPMVINTCASCRQPFDETDQRFDGPARHANTPFCRACVDRCHDSEIADHRCPVCHTAGEKTTAPAAAVTPQSAVLTGWASARRGITRQRQLLAAIQDQGGEWSTSRVLRLYGAAVPNRSDARADLKVLCRLDWLTEHDVTGRRFYTLNTPKDDQR